MVYLRQSTASQEIPLGYFVDSTDGNTEKTTLTIANTDIKLWKNGATTLANKNSGGATHISNGIYYAALDATDTDTLGPLVIFVHVSGSLTVRLECCVLAANVYDSLIGGADNLQVDTVQVGGTAQTAGDLAGLVTIVDTVVDGIDSRVLGTIAAGTHNPQSGDAYALANGANGFAAVKTDTAAIKAKTDSLNFTGTYVNVQVKGQDNIDFGALQKTSLNAATPSVTVSDKTGFALSASGIDDILDEAVEGGVTMRQTLRIFLSAFAAKASGGGTSTVVFRDIGDTKDRITLTVDSAGNRSAVTLDAT
jgi:hypothetical protein